MIERVWPECLVTQVMLLQDNWSVEVFELSKVGATNLMQDLDIIWKVKDTHDLGLGIVHTLLVCIKDVHGVL